MEQNIIEKIGEVRIADEVIAAIVGLAATDVKGVASLGGGITHDMISRSGEKNLAKSIRLSKADNKVGVKIALVLDGTVSIPEVSANTQEKVTSAVESMTGMEVTGVSVTIAGVNV